MNTIISKDSQIPLGDLVKHYVNLRPKFTYKMIISTVRIKKKKIPFVPHDRNAFFINDHEKTICLWVNLFIKNSSRNTVTIYKFTFRIIQKLDRKEPIFYVVFLW